MFYINGSKHILKSRYMGSKIDLSVSWQFILLVKVIRVMNTSFTNSGTYSTLMKYVSVQAASGFVWR